jgi:7-cyano-7-deazaguanine synthase
MPLNSLLHHNARNAPPTFDVLRDQCQQIQPRQHSLETSCVVVLSGGLDSTVCATMAALSYSRVHLMHFQYGCRAEAREAEAFLGIAEYLRARFPQTQITHSIEDLGFIKRLGGSTLTDHTLEVAQGEKGVETDNEWVPARNLVMISLAAAYCDRHGFGKIMLGLNMEEGSVFADNSIEFYQRLEAALAIGVKNAPQLTMPLGNDMKRHIVKRGIKLDAPFHLSWSCYHGGALRCSRCGPCIMRIKAFVANGLRDDPSLYVEGAEV